MDLKLIRQKILFLENLLEEKYELIQDNKMFISILEQTKNVLQEIIEYYKKNENFSEKNKNFLELYDELLKIDKILKEYKESTTVFYKNKNLYYADENFNIKKISYEDIQKKIKFLKEKYEKIYFPGEN